MPFASNDELPPRVRNNVPSARGKSIFRAAFNQAMESGKSEDVAFSIAWAALQNAGFEQNSEGLWVKKGLWVKEGDGRVNMFDKMVATLLRVAAQDDVSSRESSDRGFVKVDEEQRVVWGWASVISEKGEAVVDSQGDIISPDELVKAANEFMLDVRVAKAMHEGEQTGEVIHSLPLTSEIAKALGFETEREGWIIGMKIHDDEVWERVKAGELRAFSIGGSGLREEV